MSHVAAGGLLFRQGSEVRRQGAPIPTADVWIATTAFQHGTRVLAPDERFLRVHRIIVDLVEPEPPGK